MNELTIKNISKTFKLTRKQQKTNKDDRKEVVACNDVSFKLNRGEIYGLLGPNGAGKITCLRIISSTIKPDNGTILYNEEDIYKDISGYRKKLGFLTSELKLDEFFTPDYTFTFFGKLFGMSDEEISNRKKELFEKFGVNQYKDTKIHDLSTGMKQKTLLAVSLCHDPEIIIFDEPTNGLDIIYSKEIEDFLIEEKKKGKTILISTHIFSLVEKVCDRVGILLNGKLVKEGNLKELTKEKNLEECFFDIYQEENL